MNLFDVLNRGAAHAPKPPTHPPSVVKAAEKARAQWLNALLVDQTRAWMDLGAEQPDVLSGLAVVLTCAGFVHVHDTRRTDTPELRIIRGAISAGTSCSANGCRIRAEDARAFSAAAHHAAVIIQSGTIAGIIHAAESIRKTIGLP